MTCIVGIEHGGKVTIGADSAGTNAWLQQRIRADEKVFVTGEFAFGFCGSFRMGQLLRYKLTPPPFVENVEIDNYMATTFIDTVRQVLKDGGYARVDNSRESAGTFLVGVRGHLFRVESDYQVARSVLDYEAVGCGEEMALGALYATQGAKSVRTRLTTALEAAATFSAGVAGPFNFVESGSAS